MFDVGGGELLLIFVAVLLLFGPKKIPEVMRSVGKGLRQFRQAQEDLKQQMRDLSADVEKMTAAEEPVRVIPTPIVADKVEVLPDVSTEIEEQLPSTNEVHIQPIITPKPAESIVSRNPHSVKKDTVKIDSVKNDSEKIDTEKKETVKKVFDDTVFED